MSNAEPTAIESEFQQAHWHIRWLQNWYFSLYDEKRQAAFNREIRRYKRLKRAAAWASIVPPERTTEIDAALGDLQRARKAVENSPDRIAVQQILQLVTEVSWDSSIVN